MKAVNKPFVGQLVQIPAFEFAPMRSGWNGWIFRVGVIEKLYIPKSGRKCAKVRYCTKRAGRYQLLPCTEYSKGFAIENVFQWGKLDFAQKTYSEFKAAEDSGEPVCWDEDTAFLLQNGYIH